MRIGINAVPLTAYGGGMRQYLVGLLTELLAMNVDDELTIFHTYTGISSLRSVPHLNRHVSIRERARLVEVASAKDIYSFRDSFDVYFCPLNDLSPRMLDKPTVLTLADIQEHLHPEFFSPDVLRVRRRVYPNIARSCSTLLTLSECSKAMMVERFGLPASKVRAIHLAASGGFLEELDCLDGGKGVLPGLPQRFFFYPANLWPHKNHIAIIKALQWLQRSGGDAFHFVLTGFPTGEGVDIVHLASEARVGDQIHFLGLVDTPTLCLLYKRARALVFPSFFEGFGIPLVEAMYAECPILASSIECTKEVAGNAALYFDPNDPVELAHRLKDIDEDGRLRERIVANGRSRALDFSYKITAQKTYEAIEESWTGFIHRHRSKTDRRAEASISVVIPIDHSSVVDVLHTIRSLLSTGYQNADITLLSATGHVPNEVSDRVRGERVRCVPYSPDDRSAPSRIMADLPGRILGVISPGEIYLEPALHLVAKHARFVPTWEILIGEAFVFRHRAGRMECSYSLSSGDIREYLDLPLFRGMVFLNRDGNTDSVTKEFALLLGSSSIILQSIAGSTDRILRVPNTLCLLRLEDVGPLWTTLQKDPSKLHLVDFPPLEATNVFYGHRKTLSPVYFALPPRIRTKLRDILMRVMARARRS